MFLSNGERTRPLLPLIKFKARLFKIHFQISIKIVLNLTHFATNV
jgi:hypothetical protein